MYTLKFLIFFHYIFDNTSEYLFGIRMHPEAEIWHIFSLSTTPIMITSHFDVLFIIVMCVARQNVEIKSNILTIFKDLKPRTKVISTVGTLKPFGCFGIHRNTSHFWYCQSQKTLFHSVTLECRDIKHPSSIWYRIKRPCIHWNSWFPPFKRCRNLAKSTW